MPTAESDKFLLRVTLQRNGCLENMATNPKKGKAERKSSKRGDDASVSEEKKEEAQPEESTQSLTEEKSPTPPSPKPPTPEPVYEEPVLTLLIVESYEGDKEKGLYEGEGTAKFYGNHIYKGQFHEGLMHGKGCYVWEDGVSYEGEFISNQVTGKGLYTWTDGSTYEGDVSNGLRHGFGTFRSANNNLCYTGEWNQGKRHGKGRMDYDAEGVSFYEGDWVQNSRHGWGTRRYPSGNIYQGMWFNNMRHGEGNMRWLDKEQMYNGQWENGIQHGLGQHIWFLKRVAGSQYPLRNMYDGEFVKGLRDGYGVFFYANGSRYEGHWKDNLKNGKGKFIFKNGRIYEGQFEKDHIVEFPDFQMDGVTTPDMSKIRTRTPLPSENASVHSNDSRNTYSPSFLLEINHVLQEFAADQRPEEASRVLYVVMRHITSLRKIYNYYSSIGYEESPDNTFVMNRMQFWRFLKDCKLHYHDTTLAEMDRWLGVGKDVDEIHNPYGKVLFREFTNNLIVLAYRIFQEELEDTSGLVLAHCMSKLINENILKHACCVRGFIYHELRRAVNALVHTDQTYDIYQGFCKPRKTGRKEPSMKMREFLFLLNDLGLVNTDLTTKAVIDLLASDDPKVADGDDSCNLELEMTFLEFFEALVGCAQIYVTESVVKDPNTPRASTSMTRDQSYLSVSPSRLASHTEPDDGVGYETEGISPEKEFESERGGGGTPHSSKTTNKTAVSEGGGAAPSSAVPRGSDVQTHAETPHKSEHGGQALISHSGVSETAALSESGAAGGTTTLAGGGAVDGTVDKSGVSVLQSDLLHSEDFATEEEEELDEASRQFNFWTHQLHIFFVRKFFPVAQKMLFLKQLARERQEQIAASTALSEKMRGSRATDAADVRSVTAASAKAETEHGVTPGIVDIPITVEVPS